MLVFSIWDSLSGSLRTQTGCWHTANEDKLKWCIVFISTSEMLCQQNLSNFLQNEVDVGR